MTENQTEDANWRTDLLADLRSCVEAFGADGRNVDTAGFNELLEREVKNRAEKEVLILDMFAWTVAHSRYDRDVIAKEMASRLLRDGSEDEILVAGSERDPMAWKTCQALVGMLRESPFSEDLGESPLLDWALDVAQGRRSLPTRPGRDRTRNIVRDLAIAKCIDEIRKVGLRPATTRNGDGSAAHLVADRLCYSHHTVSGIWKRYQHHFPSTSAMP